MKRIALAIVIITLVTISGAVIGYYWVNTPASRPDSIGYKHPPMMDSNVSPFHLTVAQGATFQVNVTLTSFLDTEISIPLENLSAITYSPSHISLPQETFNYTFSPNPLILAPTVTNSSILIVKLAEDFPIGDWTMVVTFGNSPLTYVGGRNFRITVTSPIEQGTS
jgi:hypothetical protein